MLVLSRKVGEEILIGDNIRIAVVMSKSGKVRIGISAPDEVVIRRSEVPPHNTRPSETTRPQLSPVRMNPPSSPVLDCASYI